MKKVGDEDQESLVEEVEGEIQVMNQIYSVLYRLTSLRQAFIETSSIC